ncbi:MAG: hypothetical protein AAF488_12440 [Planctomycetota bacterium]
MTRKEVAEAVGTTPRRISKGKGMPVDAFEGFHVFYSEQDRCEAVEFFFPSQIRVQTEAILGRPFDQVAPELHAIDPELELDEDGAESTALGIGIYAPGREEEPASTIEGVIVFRQGYYD